MNTLLTFLRHGKHDLGILQRVHYKVIIDLVETDHDYKLRIFAEVSLTKALQVHAS